MPIISQFNYLKEIFKLEAQKLEVSVSQLARLLSISQPSVTQQLRAMAKRDLVHWKPRGSIRLTKKGARLAVNLIRKHRVIESFLVKFLDYNPHQAHIEAEDLEHLASDRFVEGLSKICGHPLYDPHGDPIPSQDGVFPAAHDYLPLEKLNVGSTAQVAALSEKDKGLLKSVTAKNIRIGSRVFRNLKGDLMIDGKNTQLNAKQVSIVYLKEGEVGGA